MAETKQVSKIIETTEVNSETGEYLGSTTQIQTFQVEKEPPYIKLYTQDIGRIYGLTKSCNDVLICLARHMSYGSNIIVLYGPVKDVICAELGMNKNTFNMAIDSLYKQGFLIRKARACYVLDPTVFGSGSWKDVQKVRLSIEYNADGTKTIKTELTKEREVQEFGRGIPMKRNPRQLELFEEEDLTC